MCRRNPREGSAGQGRPLSPESSSYQKLTCMAAGSAAGLFSSQPSGPRPVGCFSALLTPHVSTEPELEALQAMLKRSILGLNIYRIKVSLLY